MLPSIQRIKKVISLCVQVILWSASVIINPLPDWFSAANWIISQMFHILFPPFVCLLPSLTVQGDKCPVCCSDCVHACMRACLHAYVRACDNVVEFIPNHCCGSVISVLTAQPHWGLFALLKRKELMCPKLLKLFAQDWNRWDDPSPRFLFQFSNFSFTCSAHGWQRWEDWYVDILIS